MDPVQTRNVLEACLLVAGRPMTIPQLDALFEDDIDRPDRKAIREALLALAEDYAERGIELVEVAGGWRLQTRATMEHWVVRLSAEKAPRYSRALLETLVLIAYRQPITRGEIEEVRGVAVSSNIVRTLQERRWVREIGFKEVPGKPALLGTTSEFLDYFNLKRLDELPPLGELGDIDTMEAALASEFDVVGVAANDDGAELTADGEPSPARDDPEAVASGEAEGAVVPAAIHVPEPDGDPDPSDTEGAWNKDSLPPEPEPEPEPEPGSAPDGLSLAAVAERFTASTASSPAPSPDAHRDGGKETRADAGGRKKAGERQGGAPDAREDLDGEGAGADAGTDVERDGLRHTRVPNVSLVGGESRTGSDLSPGEVGVPADADSAPAGREGSERLDTGQGGPESVESGSIDVRHSTAADSSEPVSEAQSRMLDRVEAFAEEHRRELATRDGWRFRGDSEEHPGGRPGAFPTPGGGEEEAVLPRAGEPDEPASVGSAGGESVHEEVRRDDPAAPDDDP